MQRPVGVLVGVIVTLGLIGAALVALASPAAARGRCADYATQEAAQADLPSYPSLDGDHDGIACETLPHATRSVTVTVIQAPCVSDPTASVTRLYLAYFLRQPDPAGLAFWVDRCNRNISSLVDISDAFAGSPEFTQRYGALGNLAFVTLVYRNVLDRDPDAGGLKASVDFLGRGARRGEVMLGFSESPEFIARTEGAELAEPHRCIAAQWGDVRPRPVRGRLDRRRRRRMRHPRGGAHRRVDRASGRVAHRRLCRRVGTLARSVHRDHLHVARRARHRPCRPARGRLGFRSVDVVVAAAHLVRERPRSPRGSSP